jgi:hypothetical protein
MVSWLERLLTLSLSHSYKFVLLDRPSLFGGGNHWLFDPDLPVPWGDVKAVIALESSSPSEKTHSLLTDLSIDDRCPCCPICLDRPTLPVMTRCGHVYCVSCLLRYLEQEFNKRCPMCGVSVCRSDLREIFDSPPWPSNPPLASDTTGRPGEATFTLLLRLSGSLSPFRASALTDATHPSLVLGSLPSHRSVDMLFSRVCLASAHELGALWHTRLVEIDRYRASCLASAEDAFEVTLNKQATPPASLESRRGRGWERSAVALEVASPAPGPATVTVPQKSLITGEGDVEYLPFLPEAEHLIRLKLSQLEAPKVVSIPPAAGSSTRAEPPKSLRREDVIYSYQLAPPAVGEVRDIPLNPPAFLHPFCVRCLVNDPPRLAPAIGAAEGTGSESIASLLSLTQSVTARVLEVLTERVTESGRKRYPFIRHLPLDSLYRIIEIDLRDCLSGETYER